MRQRPDLQRQRSAIGLLDTAIAQNRSRSSFQQQQRPKSRVGGQKPGGMTKHRGVKARFFAGKALIGKTHALKGDTRLRLAIVPRRLKPLGEKLKSARPQFANKGGSVGKMAV